MDNSKSRKYQELGESVDIPAEVRSQRAATGLANNIVHIFQEPQGFTAMIVIEGIPKELVLKVVSDPEAYMHLSPSIVCVTYEDDTTTEAVRKMRLDMTIMRTAWWLWHTVETVDGYFIADSKNKEISLRTTVYQSSNKIEVSRIYQIDNHAEGTLVVVNVAVDKPLFDSYHSCEKYFPCRRSGINELKKEEIQLLEKLRDHVQTDSTLEMYRQQMSKEFLMSATI